MGHVFCVSPSWNSFPTKGFFVSSAAVYALFNHAPTRSSLVPKFPPISQKTTPPLLSKTQKILPKSVYPKGGKDKHFFGSDWIEVENRLFRFVGQD